MIDDNKNNFAVDQIAIAQHWMHLSDSSDQPYLSFTAQFAAFNAVYWLCSPGAENNERDMIEKFINQLRTYLRKRVHLVAPVIEAAMVFIDAARTFPVTNLGTQRNRLRPKPTKFLGREYTFQQVLDLEGQLSDVEKLDVAIDLAYQFRCNLVHGTKNILMGSNSAAAETGSAFLKSLNQFVIDEIN